MNVDGDTTMAKSKTKTIDVPVDQLTDDQLELFQDEIIELINEEESEVQEPSNIKVKIEEEH